ncbi:hemerythrin domain-containing protein [Streptomyces sp. NPDC056367]|uniref:hemerythrin domain-containing protein n=1 Tax=unclassified Streptomyces TaxID=2593676 RepID=UPI0035E20A6D
MSDRLDMTVMYATHNKLRRELTHIARATARFDSDPRYILRVGADWEMFRRALSAHQSAEDDALWPPLRQALAGRPFDLARLEAREAEHAAIASLVGAINGALTAPGIGLDLFGELAESLLSGLVGHLDHEEDTVFPLVQSALGADLWAHFRQVHAVRVGPYAPQLLPWLLDGADERTVALVLASYPAPARQAYEHRWRHSCTALDRWTAGAPVPATPDLP